MIERPFFRLVIFHDGDPFLDRDQRQRPKTAGFFSLIRLRAATAKTQKPSGVDLTFATHLAASSESECQIPNSTSNLNLLVVL
jgi:hypothetical protein